MTVSDAAVDSLPAARRGCMHALLLLQGGGSAGVLRLRTSRLLAERGARSTVCKVRRVVLCSTHVWAWPACWPRAAPPCSSRTRLLCRGAEPLP
jgi:hypothetical protein